MSDLSQLLSRLQSLDHETSDAIGLSTYDMSARIGVMKMIFEGGKLVDGIIQTEVLRAIERHGWRTFLQHTPGNYYLCAIHVLKPGEELKDGKRVEADGDSFAEACLGAYIMALEGGA